MHWSKADIHMHTTHSDGMASVEEVLDYVASATDLRVIAITDHDTIDGALEARKQAGRYPFEVIVGEEVSTIDGHVLALFIEEPIAPGQSVAATIDAIHRQGGLAIPAHPYGQLVHSIGRRGLRQRSAGELPEWRADALETFNASLWNPRNNQKAAAVAAELGLPAVGGSDAHSLATIGLGYTCFAGHSAADLRAAIVSGQVRAGGTRWTLSHLRTVARYLLARELRGLAGRATRSA